MKSDSVDALLVDYVPSIVSFFSGAAIPSCFVYIINESYAHTIYLITITNFIICGIV